MLKIKNKKGEILGILDEQTGTEHISEAWTKTAPCSGAVEPEDSEKELKDDEEAEE